MDLKTLRKHVRTLATLPETSSPLISCYLALENGHVITRDTVERQVLYYTGGQRVLNIMDLEESLEPIGKYLAEEQLTDAKGLAIFSRAGEKPFFLPLKFQVPLPNWISIDTVPNIYHLVELKKNYHRYIVMVSTKEMVRILEVNLGAVTSELWEKMPSLRKRVGREWTKQHYQKHSRDRGEKFIKEKIGILQERISAGGHTHLILAGPPEMTSRVRDKLPKHLLAKVIDQIPVSGKARTRHIVETTIASFIQANEKESRALADILVHQVRSGGLAVYGTVASLRALIQGQVDTLILARDYAPGKGWKCDSCGFMIPEQQKPSACSECGNVALVKFGIKEKMVMLAEKEGCTVEFVNESESLQQLGGVGCLLRFRFPEEFHDFQ